MHSARDGDALLLPTRELSRILVGLLGDSDALEIVHGDDWNELGVWTLTADGRCRACGTPCAGVFEPRHGSWGARRQRLVVPARVSLSQ